MKDAILFWIKQTLIAFDQFCNALFAPILNLLFPSAYFGWADETLSSVFGKLYHRCRACRFICRILNVLDWRDIDHCEDAIEWDEGKGTSL